MKVLICGSRHFYDWRLLEQTFYEFRKENNVTEIITGEAAGADSLGKQYAIYESIPYRGFPANWELHGKKAGPIRNRSMVEERPDMVLAFLAEGSKGTENMIEQATQAGVPVKVINI